MHLADDQLVGLCMASRRPTYVYMEAPCMEAPCSTFPCSSLGEVLKQIKKK